MYNKFLELINYYKSGGIHVNPHNKGKFTESAHRAGMGVQQFANHVLANKDDYSTTQIRRANFARNAANFKHEDGGIIKTDHAPLKKRPLDPTVVRRHNEAAKYGEIKQDDAGWYRKNIVRPFATWINTRPGGPVVSVLKIASSFLPGVGEALDVAEGQPLLAGIGAIPILGDAVQAAAKTGREVKKELMPRSQQ